jgi:hypothetical protein
MRHPSPVSSPEGSASPTESPCELLEWDSEHFGFPIARALVTKLDEEIAAAIDRWCRDRRIRCLYFLADADDAATARLAAERGYRVVDVRLTVERSLEGVELLPPVPEWMATRNADESDLGFVRALAARGHHGTRFYFDGGFPRELCDALYVKWVERGLRDSARTLRIAEVDGEPAAYHLLAPLGENRIGRGELLAVDERHRGRGVALSLNCDSLRTLAARGAVRHRSVRAARNVGAARYMERTGLLTAATQVWHHKWYPGPNQS